jgi:hypothetical protein
MKAELSHGEIRPLEPLPADWQDGVKLRVEKLAESDMSAEDVTRDFAALERMCAANDPADEERLEQALLEAGREAKEQVRREMGLA